MARHMVHGGALGGGMSAPTRGRGSVSAMDEVRLTRYSHGAG